MANIGGYNTSVIRQVVSYTPKPRKNYKGFFRFVGSICLFLVVIIFIINVFRVVNGSKDVSFTGFLNWLSNLNFKGVTINISDYKIGDDWGLFNGLRDFFNIFAQASGVIAWLGANVLNFLTFCAQFLAFLLS